MTLKRININKNKLSSLHLIISDFILEVPTSINFVYVDKTKNLLKVLSKIVLQ